MAGATVISPINDDPGAPNVDPLSPQDATELISLLDQLPVDELELETERFTLSLRRTGSGWVSRTTVGPSTPDGVAPVAAAAVEVPDGLVAVRSPLPGTFYRSPRPGQPPFVGDGDGVGPDTVIGLVETMKLFTSVAAGAAGDVRRVLRAGRDTRRAGRGRGAGENVSTSEPGTIRRLLVANRGEIAVRVLRTCRRLGIEGVLTVTETDAEALPARLADRVVRVPSYLDVDAVVAAARTCDALHPGYGFLSENPALAMACDAAGVRFVGPSAATLAAAGDKLAARGHAVAAGVPVLPGGPARRSPRGRSPRRSGSRCW